MEPQNDSRNVNNVESPPIFTVNVNSGNTDDNTHKKIIGEIEPASKHDGKDVSSWSPPTARPPLFSSLSVQEKVQQVAGAITVEPMLFMFVISFALCMVTTQSLVIRKYCLLDLNLSDAHCRNLTHDLENEKKAQEKASTLSMYKTLVETVPAVFIALFVGSWSDKYGRKLLMIIPNIGTCLQLVLLVVYAVYETELEPIYLLVTAVPLALSGGMIPMMVGTAAYISDASTPESRVVRLAVMQAVFMCGAPLGAIGGGVLFNQFGYVVVYIVASVLSFLCILYTIFVLKETVRKSEGPSHPCKDLFDLERVRQGLNTCFRKRENNNRTHLLLLTLAITINFFPVMGEMSVAYLYTRKQFTWSEVTYSYYSATALICSMIGLLVVLPVLKKLVHLPDVGIALICTGSRICSESMIAFAKDGWMLFASCSFQVFTGMYSPILRGMMSNIVSREEQGKLYSVVGACEASMPIIGSVLYTKVYNATTETFPGTVFLMSGSFFIIPAVIFVWLRRDQNKRLEANKTKAITNADTPT